MSELRDTVGELRDLCDRYGFAYYREWGLVLDGWSRTDGPGVDLARRGIGNLKSEGSFARMPYWLSLLADLLARGNRPGAARAREGDPDRRSVGRGWDRCPAGAGVGGEALARGVRRARVGAGRCAAVTAD